MYQRPAEAVIAAPPRTGSAPWIEQAVEQGITEAELELGTVPAMPTPTRSPRRRGRTT